MIDWHSHILPAMDDGSHSVEESLKMLAALKAQGADTVVATPHFYANEESVEVFLGRREKAYDLLCSNLGGDMPRIVCGAEVQYYAGIGRMSGLEKLTVQGTKLLLLEMPVARWTEYTLKELTELAAVSGLKIMLAHIERYLALQDRKTLERLCDCGLFIQANAEFFEKIGSRQKALKFLSAGQLHFIGSDCHNMTTRAPNIGGAYGAIAKKFGEDYVMQMDAFGRGLLG